MPPRSQEAAESEDIMEDMNMPSPRRRPSGGIGLISLVLIILVIIWLAVMQFGGLQSDAKLVSKEWQAVFLSNGQVYFGKVIKSTDRTITIDNVYYLQVVNRPLQRSLEGGQQPNQQQELTLVKLGNEIHGPVDEILINRDHVLFTEELKEDGRVVDAINRYLEDLEDSE